MELKTLRPTVKPKDLRQKILKRYEQRAESPFNYESQLLEKPELLEKIIGGAIMPPLHFEVLPTEKCNNNCVWCKGGHRDYMVSENELSGQLMLDLINELADYGIEGIVRFSGMSGEPLMNLGTLGAIRRGIDLGLKIGLINNGTLLTERTHDYLLGACYVNTSLDASNRDEFNYLKGHTGQVFDRIVENIRNLSEFNRRNGHLSRIGIGYLLHPKNYKGAFEAARLAGDIGVDILQFKLPLGPFSFFGVNPLQVEEELKRASELSREDFKVEIMQSPKERSQELCGNLPKPYFSKCYSQFLNGVVGADGNVYPCVHYYYQKGISGEAFGSLYERSFREIWEGKTRKRIMSQIIPFRDCNFCNRYDHRMNKFIDFIDVRN